jgi:hypothetical protein
VTRKGALVLVAVPAGVETPIDPFVAPLGTIARICVAESTVYEEGVPLKVTAVVSVNPVRADRQARLRSAARRQLGRFGIRTRLATRGSRKVGVGGEPPTLGGGQSRVDDDERFTWPLRRSELRSATRPGKCRRSQTV